MDDTSAPQVLPPDVLRRVFALLDVQTLCCSAVVCAEWRSLVDEAQCWEWRLLRWTHGTIQTQEAGATHPKLQYAARHKTDVNIESALAQLPWPWERRRLLSSLEALGEDAINQLTDALVGGHTPTEHLTNMPFSHGCSSSSGRNDNSTDNGCSACTDSIVLDRAACIHMHQRQETACITTTARLCPFFCVSSGPWSARWEGLDVTVLFPRDMQRDESGQATAGESCHLQHDMHRVPSQAAEPHLQQQQQQQQLLEQLDAMQVHYAHMNKQLGRRHWASTALQAVQVAVACKRMQQICEAQHVDDACVEAGALCIAQAFQPAICLQGLGSYLNALTAELKRRMSEAGVEGGRKALELLNALLFGPRSAFEQDTLHVPEPGYGLGLQGNTNNYYDPDNSLLDRVLQTGQGIPISLAVVHMAVARRAGLAVEMLGLPARIVNYLHIPLPSSGSGAATSAPAGELKPTEGIFIDVFDGGKLMDYHQLRDVMTFPVRLVTEHLRQLNPQQMHMRMCLNLEQIFASQLRAAPFDEHAARMWRCVLRLALAADPMDRRVRTRLTEAAYKCKDLQDCAESMVAAGQVQTPPSRLLKMIEDRHLEQRRIKACSPIFDLFHVGEVVLWRGAACVMIDGDESYVPHHECEAHIRLEYEHNVSSQSNIFVFETPHLLLLGPGGHAYVSISNVSRPDWSAGSEQAIRSNLSETHNLGAYFECLEPCGRRFRPNVYMRHRLGPNIRGT